MSDSSKTGSDLTEAALFYHEHPRPGKLEIQAIKPLGNQRDLALAYSPGVAAPCLAIADNPALAANYTSRGNLVAVISNGTAVLGLGNIGPLASKPVMEARRFSSRSSPASTSSISRWPRPTLKNSSMRFRFWSRPLAVSTWKTSRRRMLHD